MKTATLLIFLVSLFFIPIGQLQAQEEKIEESVSEEEMDTTKFYKLKNGYNYIIRADKEETQLIKFNLLETVFYPITLLEKSDVGLDMIDVEYERKIKPNWSWSVNGVVNADYNGVDRLAIGGGVRYYYNMNKRILKGKSANNFSANYIGPMTNYRYSVSPNFANNLSGYFVYGIQRRLGKYGYLDFKMGPGYEYKTVNLRDPNYNDEGFSLIIDFKIGLAF